MNQQDHDQRSLALHRLVVERMRADPALMERATSIVARWLSMDSSHSRPYHQAWSDALNQGLEVTAKLACADDERSTALRQSSTLSCLLSPEERGAFWRAWKEGRF